MGSKKYYAKLYVSNDHENCLRYSTESYIKTQPFYISIVSDERFRKSPEIIVRYQR